MTDSNVSCDLAALLAESVQLLAGGLGFAGEALGLLFEAGEGGCGLCLFVAGLAGALDELHGGAAMLFGLLLGLGDGADGGLGLGLLTLGGLTGVRGFGGGVFEEAAMLLELSGEASELGLGLRELFGAGGEARGELGDAVGVGGRAGGDAFEFDGGLIGLRSGFADLLVESVAAADAFGVLGVHGLDVGGLRVDAGR